MYVGETERTIAERLKEHLADVRHERNKAVAVHFNEPDHDISDFQIVILEKCADRSRYYRKIRELFWIERLNTIIPSGLNKKSQLGVLGQIINLKFRAINRNAVYRRHTQVTLKWRHQFGALVVMTSKQCRLFTLHGLCVEVSSLTVLLTFNQLCSSKNCLSTWRRLRPKRCSSIKLQN